MQQLAAVATAAVFKTCHSRPDSAAVCCAAGEFCAMIGMGRPLLQPSELGTAGLNEEETVNRPMSTSKCQGCLKKGCSAGP